MVLKMDCTFKQALVQGRGDYEKEKDSKLLTAFYDSIMRVRL